MDVEKHIELAIRIVKDGEPFFSENGIFGVRKGTMSVHMDDGKLHLVCGNLIPVELQMPKNPEIAKKFKRIKSDIEDIRSTLSSM